MISTIDKELLDFTSYCFLINAGKTIQPEVHPRILFWNVSHAFPVLTVEAAWEWSLWR